MREVISNTTTILILSKLDKLYLLKDVYQTIVISKEVNKELNISLPSWITVKSVKDNNLTKVLSGIVDIGEASTIALGLENPNSMLIIDDLKGRKLAKKFDLQLTGLLGIAIKFKECGFIENLKDFIYEIKNVGFYISDSLINNIIDKYENTKSL